MNCIRIAQARLFGLIHKDRLDSEIEEELRFHLEMQTQANIARGMSPEEASRAARRQFGNVGRIKEEWRDVAGGGGIELLLQDLKFAIRLLRRDAGFTITAVLALALGIAANTALFTLISSVLLRPLPFHRPNRIVTMWNADRGTNGARPTFSHLDFRDLQARSTSFETLGAFQSLKVVANFDGREGTEVQATQVTPEVFSVLRVRPALGRTFAARDESPGNGVCILSDELWRDRFGRSRGVTKESLLIDGREFPIIGVMPPDFRFPIQNEPTLVWTSFAIVHETHPDGTAPYSSFRAGRMLTLLGRLRDGCTTAEASRDLSAIAADLAEKFPETNRNFDSITVVPWLFGVTHAVQPALLLLLGAAGCVLLLACVNIANLLLARASTRQKEIAVRAALGAGWQRIVRQLLTESVLLGAIGGTIGLLLAVWGTGHLVALLPLDFPRRNEIAPDVRVLLFTIAATLVTSFVFGFAPAWRSARAELAPVLNDSSRGTSEGRRGRVLRKSLVVVQMVIAFVLLVGAFFLLQSFAHLEKAPLGFEPRGLLTISTSVATGNGPGSRLETTNAFRDLLGRLRQLDGIEAAAAVFSPPISGNDFVADFEIMDRPMHRSLWPRAEVRSITPGYFATMQIPMVSGRDFDERDDRNGVPTVIVNETLAREIFPGVDPIGKRIRPGFSDTTWYPEREIVGVVADARSDALVVTPAMQAYLPHGQCSSDQMTLLLRSKLPVDDVAQTVRETFQEVWGGAAVDEPSTMTEELRIAFAQPRLHSAVLSLFAIVALVLTAVGVYGVMAYSAAQRRHEIGIRLALGAQKLEVFRLLLGEGFRIALVSVVLGTAATMLVGRLSGNLSLAGGNAFIATSSGAFLLITIALVACWIPAHRAANDDPLAAVGLR